MKAAIVRYATNAIKSVIVDVKTDKILDSFYDTKSSLPHVLLFTTKPQPTPLYKVSFFLSFDPFFALLYY